jgi:UDP-N-acetylglucosamine 2-epimerase (non-hydrolysing)
MIQVLFVLGTRPEAIKLAPLALHLGGRPQQFRVRVCVTAQHRSLLDGVLARFGVVPDFDLNVMRPDQSLAGLTARILEGLDPILERVSPDIVLVQGDTTTTLAGALAAFYRHIPVGHVEAGLRTHDFDHPFPEELNRVLATRLTTLHFAPTDGAAAVLRREGVAEDGIFVTGNTGIDALLYARDRLESGAWPGFDAVALDSSKQLILMTAHRRESFGAPLRNICAAVRTLAGRGDVEIVYPMHPNPNVRRVVEPLLSGIPGVHLIEPLDYVPFVDLMRRADLLLTDSGGIQEEAPSLGKPVLVLRETTERPEAVDAGSARLVGSDPGTILAAATELLKSIPRGGPVTRRANPFGDGGASPRIADAILSFFSAKLDSAALVPTPR